VKTAWIAQRRSLSRAAIDKSPSDETSMRRNDRDRWPFVPAFSCLFEPEMIRFIPDAGGEVREIEPVPGAATRRE
jgi:hypothetical protein